MVCKGCARCFPNQCGFAFSTPLLNRNHPARMAATIPGRKVYKFRMEPTGLEAPELERAASVARAF
jgi:hypothetical protein